MLLALVAGGSKGIGFAIATALARRGYNLLLIARHVDKLEEAKRLLEDTYKIAVHIISADLSEQSSTERIRNYCIANNLEIDILCNVAGIGGAKYYLSIPLEEIRYMIHLNVESAIALTNAFLPLLRKKQRTYILNVASMAGFGPIPVKNVYSSTKSAIIFFSRALRSQLKDDDISVSCLCPGPVFTKPEIQKDTIEKMGWFGKMLAVKPERVGEIAVRATLKGQFMIIPGFLPKVVSFFVRILPVRLLVFIYEQMIERSSSK
jgi:hypothetical protein